VKRHEKHISDTLRGILTVNVASVKRKKSIELSKRESMPLYTGELGAPWNSMEVHGLCYYMI